MALESESHRHRTTPDRVELTPVEEEQAKIIKEHLNPADRDKRTTREFMFRDYLYRQGAEVTLCEIAAQNNVSPDDPSLDSLRELADRAIGGNRYPEDSEYRKEYDKVSEVASGLKSALAKRHPNPLQLQVVFDESLWEIYGQQVGGKRPQSPTPPQTSK